MTTDLDAVLAGTLALPQARVRERLV